MIDKFLQHLRGYLIGIDCISDAFAGIHLTGIASKKLPCLIVKQLDFDRGSAGQANVELAIEIHVNSLNMNDDLQLSLLVSSTLEGASFAVSNKQSATLKWKSSKVNTTGEKRVITQNYIAMIMENNDD